MAESGRRRGEQWRSDMRRVARAERERKEAEKEAPIAAFLLDPSLLPKKPPGWKDPRA